MSRHSWNTLMEQVVELVLLVDTPISCLQNGQASQQTPSERLWHDGAMVVCHHSLCRATIQPESHTRVKTYMKSVYTIYTYVKTHVYNFDTCTYLQTFLQGNGWNTTLIPWMWFGKQLYNTFEWVHSKMVFEVIQVVNVGAILCLVMLVFFVFIWVVNGQSMWRGPGVTGIMPLTTPCARDVSLGMSILVLSTFQLLAYTCVLNTCIPMCLSMYTHIHVYIHVYMCISSIHICIYFKTSRKNIGFDMWTKT